MIIIFNSHICIVLLCVENDGLVVARVSCCAWEFINQGSPQKKGYPVVRASNPYQTASKTWRDFLGGPGSGSKFRKFQGSNVNCSNKLEVETIIGEL